MSQTKAQLIDPTDGSIVNADINASAAIAGTKVSPDFGSQNIVTTGSVGIGIGSQTPSTPQKQLHIAHDSSPRIMLSNDTTGHATPNGTELLLDSNGNFEIFQRENLNVEFFTNGSQRMTINGSGDIGIGTTSPNEKLVVQGNSSVTGALFITSNTSTPSAGAFLYRPASNTLALGSNSAERMRIDSSGNVGIGTTSPSANLHLRDGSGNTEIKLQGGASTANDVIAFLNSAGSTRGNITYDTDNDFVLFNVNTSERMRINNLGQVQIGDTTAADTSEMLKVDGAGGNDHCGIGVKTSNNVHDGYIAFHDSDANFRGQLRYDHSVDAMFFNTAGSERMRITGDGPHLLLGGTSDVNEITESSATAGMVIGGTGFGNAGLAIITSTSGTGRLYFGDEVANAAGRNRGQINYGHSDDHMRFVTASTERMRIDSSGNVGIGSSPLSRLSIVDSVSSSALMIIRNNQTRANGVRYGIEFRDSSNETNGSIVAVQTGSNNQASFEFYVNNGNGGNGITGGSSGIKSVTIGPGGLITHKEFNMHDAGGTASAKFLDFGFQGNSCNFRRTNGNDGGHANFMTVNSSNVVSGDFNDTSDEKLKKNILSVVDGAIENIKKLRPVTFDWIDETRKNDVSGFVAQEVKEVLPNLIDGTEYDPTLIDETKGSKGGIKSEGYSINTIGLVAHLTKALQEAVAKIETLETKVAALEAA